MICIHFDSNTWPIRANRWAQGGYRVFASSYHSQVLHFEILNHHKCESYTIEAGFDTGHFTCKSPSPINELPVTSNTASLVQPWSLDSGPSSPSSLFKERFKVSKLAREDMSGKVVNWFNETSKSFKLVKESKGGRLFICKIVLRTQISLNCYLISFQHKGCQIRQIGHFNRQT